MSLDESLPAAHEIDPLDGPKLLVLEPSPMLRLDQLPLGATAVLGAPDRLTPTVLRLLEMGLTPGTEVALTRRAPGGDPIEIRVRGTRLCVRRADLACFAVTAVELPAQAPGRSRTGR